MTAWTASPVQIQLLLDRPLLLDRGLDGLSSGLLLLDPGLDGGLLQLDRSLDGLSSGLLLLDPGLEGLSVCLLLVRPGW